MSLEFSQYEVESELGDIVKHGTRKEIAKKTGIYDSVIYGMFNADDERKSAIFVTLQIICAADEIDENEGEQLWQSMKRFRELSKKHFCDQNNIASATGKLSKEVADVVLACLENKPYYEQLKEICEAESQLAETKKAVIAAINNEKETGGRKG